MSLLPRSLVGRLALVLALALLAAQSVSFVLLARAQERVAASRTAGMAVAALSLAGDTDAMPGPRGRRLARMATRRTWTSEAAPEGVRLRRVEAMVADELDAEVRAVLDRGGRRPAAIVAVRQGEGWVNARVPAPPARSVRLAPLAAQTFVIYLVLLVPVLWIGRQVARPLDTLTQKTARYRPGDPPEDSSTEGPEDIANLARAVTAMQARIAEDLAQRDAMLGAIGHDLRTPLTSLRLRTEQVTDQELRAKMIATLARTEALLDDTLALARSGQPAGERAMTNMADFAQAEVEAARAAGLRVTLGTADAVSAPIYASALSRAVQNIVKNADCYAGGGTISVRRDGIRVVVAVTDEGPGLPDGFTPAAFARGEGSRNRATGGAGLGLAIARRVAEAHGGGLALTPRPGGGTVAAISLPSGAGALIEAFETA